MDKDRENPLKSGYQASGVGLDRAEEVVRRIARMVQARPSQALSHQAIGAFAGSYRLDDQTTLLAGADGVGTKILVARAMGAIRELGLDLVAMNVNDVLASGGRPLFFLDYIAAGYLEPDEIELLIGGILDGCEEADCVLLGGETAEMPGLYAAKDFDLAGFSVGVQVFEPKPSQPGDRVLGIMSRGFHANGFSLVRHIVETAKLDYQTRYAEIGDAVLGQVLLAPTPIYVQPVLALLKAFPHEVKSLAHITGGGLVDNLPRALAPKMGALLERGRWAMPPIFRWFQELGNLSDQEMVQSFNGGIGFAIIVQREAAHAVRQYMEERGLAVADIGQVTAAPGISVT